MLDSQLYRRLSLAVAVLGFMTMAGCAGQRATVASTDSAQPADDGASKATAPSPAGDAASKAAVPSPARDATSKAPEASPARVSADAPKPLHLVTLPRGTEITAVVEQTLASNKNHWGDPFAARIVKPVKVDGKTVLPRGTEVTGSVWEVKKNELKVVLDSVVVHGVDCDLSTHSRRPSDKDQPKRRGQKKDNSKLSARTQLTFKLSKAAAVPVKA